MGENSNSLFGKALNNVFPHMPDFYGYLNEQCDVVAQAGDVLVAFMEKNDPAKGEEMAALEHQADALKNRNLTILNKAFATPMDREDIFRAISSIDMVLNYMKTTVREMQTLQVSSDSHTVEMAHLLRDGVVALRQGYAKLAIHPASAQGNCAVIAKTERNIEKVYSNTIAQLFTAEESIQDLQAHSKGAEVNAMVRVLDMFRRREIYRHLSNAGDYLAQAGNTLHDIVVQIA